jgi:hypothetical protein
MCEMQKYIPPCFFNAQEHYLIHLVGEIEICGPIHNKVNIVGGEALEGIEGFF